MHFTAEEEAYLLSPPFQSRFTYREAKRPESALEKINIRQLGHMVENLTDAMIFIRLLSDNPHIDVNKDPAYEPESKHTPPHVDDFVQDPRLARTYHRSDIGRERLKRRTHLTVLADHLHGTLRKQGNIVGNTLVIPAELQPLVDQYDKMIERYKELVAAYEGNHERIPQEERTAYEKDYNELADQLFSALRSLPVIKVKIGSQQYSIPNNTQLNKRLPDSCPALVLFALRSAGKEMIDRNKRPSPEFKRLLDVIGVESLITDTMQELFDHAAVAGVRWNIDLSGNETQKHLKERARDIQLAIAFCQIADCGYQTLYDDLVLFAHLGDVSGSTLAEIRTPDEAAFLLYAVERGFTRRSITDTSMPKLQEIAAGIARCGNLEVARARFGNNNVQQVLQDSLGIAQQHGMKNAVVFLQQLEKRLTPPQTIAEDIDSDPAKNQALG